MTRYIPYAIRAAFIIILIKNYCWNQTQDRYFTNNLNQYLFNKGCYFTLLLGIVPTKTTWSNSSKLWGFEINHIKSFDKKQHTRKWWYECLFSNQSRSLCNHINPTCVRRCSNSMQLKESHLSITHCPAFNLKSKTGQILGSKTAKAKLKPYSVTNCVSHSALHDAEVLNANKNKLFKNVS